MSHLSFRIEQHDGSRVLRLLSVDRTNRLTLQSVLTLTEAVKHLSAESHPIIVAGNENFFSVGADLTEIAALHGAAAYEFSRVGQALMTAIESFPATVCAAVSGFCMGGGFDLALACRRRIAAPNAVFGHRGAALGLITGWGGTQRLPRLIGKGRALQLFVAADRISAEQALEFGMIDAIADDPVAHALKLIRP